MKTIIKRDLTEMEFRRAGMLYIANDLMLGRSKRAYIKIEELRPKRGMARYHLAETLPRFRIRLIGR